MKAIGLMSGTSVDAIDVALLETDGKTIDRLGPAAAYPFTAPEYQLLREAMASAIGLTSRNDRSAVLGLAEQTLTDKHIAAVLDFVENCGLDLSDIDVIGFHGQTVLHKPEAGLTVQLGDGQRLARALNVPTVFDFRAADMEQGGQGAPLVPIYHRALALQQGLPLPAAFVNIGGIANVTLVADGPADRLIAFDAGPGNCLVDDWALKHLGVAIDEDAALALSGQVHQPTLNALLSHPFFAARPPKSLDRGTFVLPDMAGLSAADGAATLTAFTVAGIGAAARFFPEPPKVWILSGGGVHNPFLLAGLRRVLNGQVLTADEAGFNADYMEAEAFAFLAVRHLHGLPASFPGTTGVRAPAVLGVLNRPEPAHLVIDTGSS